MGQREVYEFLQNNRGKKYTARQIANYIRHSGSSCTLAVCRLVNHKQINFKVVKLRQVSDSGQPFIRTVRKVWV